MSTGTVDRLRLTAILEPGDDGWINARVLEFPGANTCGRTVEEAKDMLADAVRELVASYAEEARRSGVEQRSIRAARDRPHLNRARLEQHLVQHGCERLREAGATMSICRDLGVDLPRDLS